MDTLLLAQLTYLGTAYVEYWQVMSFRSFEACFIYGDLNSENIAHQLLSNYRSMVDDGSQSMVLDSITLGCTNPE
jgi:hypothetical protein|tara:strand:- start:153 stop:377 length:225 start_codon:yes stop_codon:yes gene_type:complete